MNVRLERDGDLARVVLSAPPTHALDRPEFTDPVALAAHLSADGVRGAIVVGEGRHFSGGADREALAALARDPRALAEGLTRGKALLDVLAGAPVPVVAAIRGQCLGAGLEIALACHFRVAAASAMLGFPEATLGLLPGLGGTVPAGLRLPRGALADLLVTGRLVGAEEARTLGLVDRVVPAPETEAAAAAFARELVGDRPDAVVRAVMESVRDGLRLPRPEALRRETERFCRLARM